MAGKTKFRIDVTFERKVPLSHVSGSKLQKEKGGQATLKTLGVTKPSVAVTTPVLYWDEATDPIAKTVSLGIKKIEASVTYSAQIWIDKDIDRGCDCYAHVFAHEKQHAKIWKDGSKKFGKQIVSAVEAVAAPTIDNPVKAKQAEAKGLREEAFRKIDKALKAAVVKYGKLISKESKKIHTSSELSKTNRLCEEYLI